MKDYKSFMNLQFYWKYLPTPAMTDKLKKKQKRMFTYADVEILLNNNLINLAEIKKR